MAGDPSLAGAAAGVDPNWLLSTTAQSAAAIVAIVGGFLVSRVVGLAGEVGELRRRRDHLDAQHRDLVREREKLAADRSPMSAASLGANLIGDFGVYPRPAEPTPQDKLKREADLGVEARSVLAERKRVERALSTLHRPRGLWWGVGVLTYFGLVGTVLPLALMSRRPVPSSDCWRTAVVLLFLSGFLAVVVYVVSLVVQIPSSTSSGKTKPQR